ncbi:MAG: hypothetical protein OEY79_04515, partial [Anaplasmataceae bacterium]|nr:hypothetical protein [Anaplasmataceae bacterium]
GLISTYLSENPNPPIQDMHNNYWQQLLYHGEGPSTHPNYASVQRVMQCLPQQTPRTPLLTQHGNPTTHFVHIDGMVVYEIYDTTTGKIKESCCLCPHKYPPHHQVPPNLLVHTNKCPLQQPCTEPRRPK